MTEHTFSENVFTTPMQAKKSLPKGWRVFKVTRPDGSDTFVQARNVAEAMGTAALSDGYAAEQLDLRKVTPRGGSLRADVAELAEICADAKTKEGKKIAAMLAELVAKRYRAAAGGRDDETTNENEEADGPGGSGVDSVTDALPDDEQSTSAETDDVSSHDNTADTEPPGTDQTTEPGGEVISLPEPIRPTGPIPRLPPNWGV